VAKVSAEPSRPSLSDTALKSRPAAPPVTDDASLGERLRLRRKALGKTQQQVADEASLTIGFISQVERGLSSPSLASLANLAKALQTTVDFFVTNTPVHRHSIVTHSGERRTYRAPGLARSYEFFERGFADATLNACLSHVPPGHASETFSHEGEEFVYLVAGRMLYEVDGISYELGAGDTLHFDSRRPHRGTNIGTTEAVELWVGTMRIFPE
jgi:transcriptional regulator with XRE-family HTH domain